MFRSTWFKRSYTTATVYIDTACMKCTTFGDFLKAESSDPAIHVTSFADTSLQRYLSEAEITAMQEMVYVEDEVVYKGAEAIIMSVSSLGGIWVCIRVLRIVPRSLRHRVYRWISDHRS